MMFAAMRRESLIRDLVKRIRLLVVVTGAIPGAATSQDSLMIRDAEAVCTSCRLSFQLEATYRVPGSEAALVSPFVFALDSEQRLYFNDPTGTVGIRVFNRGGGFMRTTGRGGQGPGEFAQLSAITFDGLDTLHAFGNAHWVFDAAGRHVRTVSTPGYLWVRRALRLRDGTYVLVAAGESGTAAGQPFHVTNGSGSIVASFGRPSRVLARSEWTEMRALVQSTDDAFIAASANSYRLEEWSTSGRLKRVLRREAGWFRDWSSWDLRTSQPPPPRLLGLAYDRSGRIWTLSVVPSARWIAPKQSGGEIRRLSVADLQETYDSVIEVIDSNSGRLIASARVSQMFVALIAPGIAVENVEDDRTGEVFVRRWNIALTR